MTDLLDRIPAPIRSLWKAEAALRRGLWASVLSRGEPNPHYGEARRHFDEALASRRSVPDDKGEWGGAAHVAATIEQDEIEKAASETKNTGTAPRL